MSTGLMLRARTVTASSVVVSSLGKSTWVPVPTLTATLSRNRVLPSARRTVTVYVPDGVCGAR